MKCLNWNQKHKPYEQVQMDWTHWRLIHEKGPKVNSSSHLKSCDLEYKISKQRRWEDVPEKCNEM